MSENTMQQIEALRTEAAKADWRRIALACYDSAPGAVAACGPEGRKTIELGSYDCDTVGREVRLMFRRILEGGEYSVLTMRVVECSNGWIATRVGMGASPYRP